MVGSDPVVKHYAYWIPVIVIFSILIPFLLLPLTLQAGCVIYAPDTDFKYYTHLYGDAISVHTFAYIFVPLIVTISTFVAAIALAKLSVSTWGRSFDPPRKPWAILLILDALIKLGAAALLPIEFYYQCTKFPSSRPSSEPSTFVYMELILILTRICLVGFILSSNSMANISLARAHIKQDKEEMSDYEVEMDDDVFSY